RGQGSRLRGQCHRRAGSHREDLPAAALAQLAHPERGRSAGASQRLSAGVLRFIMPKFAANLTLMFNELSFLDRFAGAAEAGFKGVEFLFPYEPPPEAVAAALKANGLQNVLFNLPPGNWAAGEKGIACLPGREAEFRESVATALRYARALGTPRVHAMAGLVP